MAEFIYQMYQARKAHGDKVILDDVTLSFYPGAKIGVVGPNGMGKSTLLKIMAGIEEVSNGDARLTPGYTVGILQQEPPLDDDKTVIENVRMAFGDMIAKVDRFNKIGEEMCDPDCDMDALMAEMGKLQDEIDAADGWDIDSKLGQAMDALQLPDSDMPVNVLSGGERRRVALCKLLLEAPDLLLLDEPTNHLDAESILWLEHFLHNYQGAVLAVTHDRYFLDNVAERICEVDRGHLYPSATTPRIWRPRPPVSRRRATATPNSPSAWRPSSSGYAARPGSPGQEQGPSGSLRGDGGRGPRKPETRLDRHPHPRGPASGQQGARGSSPAQGVRWPCAHRRPIGSPCRATISWASSAPTVWADHAAGKTIVGLEPLTSGELEVGETVDLLCRSEPFRHRPR